MTGRLDIRYAGTGLLLAVGSMLLLISAVLEGSITRVAGLAILLTVGWILFIQRLRMGTAEQRPPRSRRSQIVLVGVALLAALAGLGVGLLLELMIS